MLITTAISIIHEIYDFLKLDLLAQVMSWDAQFTPQISQHALLCVRVCSCVHTLNWLIVRVLPLVVRNGYTALKPVHVRD